MAHSRSFWFPLSFLPLYVCVQFTLDDDDDEDEDEYDDPAEDSSYTAPFARDQYNNCLRRTAGRLGLDFVVAIFRQLTKQLDTALENVVGQTMSSTGFVTFLDLASTTCAASAPLTVKATVLDVSIAPEPRVRSCSVLLLLLHVCEVYRFLACLC